MAILKNTIFLLISSFIFYSCDSDELSQISITSSINATLDIEMGMDSVLKNDFITEKFIITDYTTQDALNSLRIPTDKVSDIVPKNVVFNISTEGKGDLNSFRQIRVFLTTSPEPTDDNILNNWVQIARLDTIPTISKTSLTLIPEVISVKDLILGNNKETLFVTCIMETRREIKMEEVFNTNIITNYQVSGKLD